MATNGYVPPRVTVAGTVRELTRSVDSLGGGDNLFPINLVSDSD